MSDCLKWFFNCIFGNRDKGNRDKEKTVRNRGRTADELQSFSRTPPTEKRLKKEDVSRVFTSPEGISEDNIQDHAIRLRERGYEVISLLGSGGYGSCYEVKKLSNGTKLAIKIMNLKDFGKDNSKLFEVFSSELWILKNAPHSNIIALVDHFMYDKLYTYTVLEIAEKGTLEMKCGKSLGKPLNELQAKIYFFQISRAIDHLHGMGIAHRDIKLSNILICSLPNNKEVIKVADFGLSRVSYTSDYGTFMINKPIGSLFYMSPQLLTLYLERLNKMNVISRRRTDPFKADIWALGVSLYIMLTSNYPFDEDIKHMNPEERKLKVTNMYKKQMDRNLSIPQFLTNECNNLLLDTLEVDKEKRIQMSGIVRNMWFDKWLDTFNVNEINKIDLNKFLDSL